MCNDELSIQSMDFAVQIINLVKDLKSKHETIISDQIVRSGTSIGANIRVMLISSINTAKDNQNNNIIKDKTEGDNNAFQRA